MSGWNGFINKPTCILYQTITGNKTLGNIERLQNAENIDQELRDIYWGMVFSPGVTNALQARYNAFGEEPIGYSQIISKLREKGHIL